MKSLILTALVTVAVALPSPGAVTSNAPPVPSPVERAITALPPNTRQVRIDVKRDCGAKGDGFSNDTQAFQKAAQLIQAAGGGTLVIPKSTYIVGLQKHVAGSYPYYQPEPILELKNVNGLLIEGHGAILKLAPDQRYGSFDKETGEIYKPKLPFYDRTYAANAGIMLQIAESRNIVIRDLELDGNLSALKMGGLWGDTGRQLLSYGVHLSNNRDVFIDHVNSHHHATDGTAIGFTGLKETDLATKHTLIDCSFQYNGRQGLSWVGGRGLTAIRCKFNHTGRALNNGEIVSSAPGAGLDIEAEDSVTRDGDFQDCEFIDNAGAGMVADSGDGGYSRFSNCTFWGTTNFSAWCRKPGLKFVGSRFYGSVVHAVGSPDPALATSWTDCSFEDKPWTDGKVYRQNTKAYLLELNGPLRNVKFDKCSFTANTSRSLWLDANSVARPEFLDCTIVHRKADLPDHDFQALMRHVDLKRTRFTESFLEPTQKQWLIVAEDIGVGEKVSVEGPRVKWGNWSGKTGVIPPVSH